MKIAGFNFNKISVEKFSSNFEDLKINTKIDLPEIKKIQNNLLKSEEVFLSVSFTYSITYDPKVAEINFTGNILLALDSKKAEEVLKQWKNKQLPKDFKLNVLNLIVRKTAIKALPLEDEMGLLPHISLPVLRQESSEKQE